MQINNSIMRPHTHTQKQTNTHIHTNTVTSDTNDGMWLGGALRSRAEIDGGKIVVGDDDMHNNRENNINYNSDYNNNNGTMKSQACAHRFMNKEWGEGSI